MATGSRSRPAEPELAISRVRRLFPDRSRRTRAVFAVVVVLIWGTAWLVHRHVGAAFHFGVLDGSVHWSIDSASLGHGGATAVSLKGRFQPYFLNPYRHRDPLAPLADLHRVESLDLSDCPELTDRDLAVLKRLPHLKSLALGRSDTPWVRDARSSHHADAVAGYLAGLKDLEELDLSGTDLTDRGAAALAGLKNLKSLDLSRTAITDAGLKQLADLPGLEWLQLDETKVSPEAAADLAQRRPTLNVGHPALTPQPEAIIPAPL